MKSAIISFCVRTLSLVLVVSPGLSIQVYAQETKKKEQLDIWFSSSSHDSCLVRCENQGKKHVYILEVPPAERGKPDNAAAISICGINSSRELRDPILRFKWAAIDEKPTTIPLLRIQYSKRKDFMRYLYNVSQKEFSSTPVENGENLVCYRLPTGNFGNLMRVAIVGRAKQSIGAYFRIADLEIEGINPGKTLPFSSGASDPILSNYCGKLDRNHSSQFASNRQTFTKRDLAEFKGAYKAANRLTRKVLVSVTRGQKATDITSDPQWKQECAAVEKH